MADSSDTALIDALIEPVAVGFSRTSVLMVAASARERLYQNSEAVRKLSAVEVEAFGEAVNALDRLAFVLRANIGRQGQAGQGR